VKPVDILLAMLVPVLWGMGFIFAKAGLEHFPPILLMCLRFTVAALVLIWFFKPPWAELWRIFVIAVISATVTYGLLFTGLRDLDASTAIIVIQLEVPFAVILAAVFLKDPLGWRRVIGLLLAFAGVALIAGQPRLSDGTVPLLMVVGGGFAWAIGQVLVRTLGGRVSGFRLIAWVSALSAPQLLVSSLIFEHDQWTVLTTADWRHWAVVLYLGLFMTALGYATWYHLLGRHPVNQVMPFLLLVPVTSMAGGALVLGEELTLVTILGAAIVISGVAFITLGKPARARPKSEPAGP
jgi:O-acetylserine/cysteine efflux transporter